MGVETLTTGRARNKLLTSLRFTILNHLGRGRVVWIFDGDGCGSRLAIELLSSRQFRSFFVPLIHMSRVSMYKRILSDGFWANARNVYYFVDPYDVFKVSLDKPAMLVSSRAPDTELEKVVILPESITPEAFFKHLVSSAPGEAVREKLRAVSTEAVKAFFGIRRVITVKLY